MQAGGGAQRGRSLAGRFLTYQLLIAVVTVVCVGTVAVVMADRSARDSAAERSRALALTLAASPAVAAGLGDADPAAGLQPLAERVRAATDVSFVVVMAPDGTRYSHPDPDRIGDTYLGTIAPAVAGEVLTETYGGTLGPSIRTVAPVRADPLAGTGPVIGLVSVGITTDRVGGAFRAELPLLLGALATVAVLAVAGSWALAGLVRRRTFGLDPDRLAAIYEHHLAVLHNVREGLLVIDPAGHLVLANDEARALLDLDDDAEGRPVAELGLDGQLGRLLTDQEPMVDAIHLAGERLVVVSQVRAGIGERDLGTVVTMRDRTELIAATWELGASRTLAESLRAHVHETANRLHTIATLIELEEHDAAIGLATSHATGARGLDESVAGRVDDPVVAALLLGKMAEAGERSVTLELSDDSRLPRGVADPDDLVAVLGNLIDNAIDAASGSDPAAGGSRLVEVTVLADDGHLLIEVADTGPGVSPEAEAQMFEAGWSTKDPARQRLVPHGIGLTVVRRVVERVGGEVSVHNQGGAVVTVRLPIRSGAGATR